MTELTPNEIADYPLRTAVRGYRVEQVDELLDRVADRIETLQTENATLRERLQAAEGLAEEASATEATLKRTLVTAQRAAEETVAEARTEAARLRADAQEAVDELLGQARAEADDLRARAADELERAQARASAMRDQVDREVAGLREAADRFRVALRDHLDAHAVLLEQVPSAADLPDVPGGSPDAPPAGDPDHDSMQGSPLFAANSNPAAAQEAGDDFSR